MTEPIKVNVLGRSHAVVLPDYAAREELVVAYGEAMRRKGVALLRVYAAAVGLCTRIGREAEADYAAHRFDVLAYGGAVYTHLRGAGLAAADLAAAAGPILVAVMEATFPRAVEVEAVAGNSGGSAATPTELP